ncbi:MAG TPA: hypothetical protein VGE57_13800 [Solimonas sp.]
MSQSVRASARVHRGAAKELPAAMFTLTHRVGEKPEPGDVTKFVDCLRKWALRKFKVRRLRYVWVAELQEDRAAKGDAGAVHYHVAVWLPAELKRIGRAKADKLRHRYARITDACSLPKPDAKGWWKKGSTERAWVRKSVNAYLAKYLSKGAYGAMPKGLRIHGAGGFEAVQRDARAFLCLPMWLKKQVGPADRCTRLPAGVWVYPDGRREPGGGWVSRLTGECFRSPWRLISFGRMVRIVRVQQCEVKAVTPSFEP